MTLSQRLIQLAEKVDPFSDLDSFIVVIENHEKTRSVEYWQALVGRLEAGIHCFRKLATQSLSFAAGQIREKALL